MKGRGFAYVARILPRRIRPQLRDQRKNGEKEHDRGTGDVALTEQAAKRIVSLLGDEAPGSVFRVAVEGGGCSGFQYKFAIDAAAAPRTRWSSGRRARRHRPRLARLSRRREIDFVNDLMGQSFRVDNPNAVSSCGCGTSFSL